MYHTRNNCTCYNTEEEAIHFSSEDISESESNEDSLENIISDTSSEDNRNNINMEQLIEALQRARDNRYRR